LSRLRNEMRSRFLNMVVDLTGFYTPADEGRLEKDVN